MHLLIKKITLFSGLLFFVNQQLTAQQAFSKYEIGINAGIFIYQGDLTPYISGSFKTAKPGIGLHFSRTLNPAFSVRLNFYSSNLTGNDADYGNPAYRQQRNFKFSTPLNELSCLLVYDISRSNNDKQRQVIVPYILGGAGYTFVKVKREYSNMNPVVFPANGEVAAGLDKDLATPLPKGIATLPVGVGLRAFLSGNIFINVESSIRFMFTDYLDGFSKAVNPHKNDHYYDISFGLIYCFSQKNPLRCPVVRL